jgi:hypothetical protein
MYISYCSDVENIVQQVIFFLNVTVFDFFRHHFAFFW